MPTATADTAEKVRSILIRADRTTFAGERETALGLARKLAAKHNLGVADLHPVGYLIGIGSDPTADERRRQAVEDAMNMAARAAARHAWRPQHTDAEATARQRQAEADARRARRAAQQADFDRKRAARDAARAKAAAEAEERAAARAAARAAEAEASRRAQASWSDPAAQAAARADARAARQAWQAAAGRDSHGPRQSARQDRLF